MTDIIDHIPQKKPILLVDGFLGISDDGISRTRLTIEASNIFLDGRKFSACGMIEHMAQSAAARKSWMNRLEGKPDKEGYIGSISGFEMISDVFLNDAVETELEILQELGNMSMVEARSFVNGVLVAKGRLGIVIAE